jgi:uncharacterized membrane protein YkvA (DUF1232 family)
MDSSGFSLEIRKKIESFLDDEEVKRIVTTPSILSRIKKEYPKKSQGLKQKLGQLYPDLDLFFRMRFDPAFQLGDDAAVVAAATLNYYLNPLDVQSVSAPLLGIIDDALLLAVAAKKCRSDLDRYIKFTSSAQTDI